MEMSPIPSTNVEKTSFTVEKKWVGMEGQEIEVELWRTTGDEAGDDQSKKSS